MDNEALDDLSEVATPVQRLHISVNGRGVARARVDVARAVLRSRATRLPMTRDGRNRRVGGGGRQEVVARSLPGNAAPLSDADGKGALAGRGAFPRPARPRCYCRSLEALPGATHSNAQLRGTNLAPDAASGGRSARRNEQRAEGMRAGGFETWNLGSVL